MIGTACDKKLGGSEARKPLLKSGGGLKPSSLIEVYAYDYNETANNTIACFTVTQQLL